MISSQEFQRKLQSGQIYEALALILSETNKIDVITQLTDELTPNVSYTSSTSKTTAASPNREYLRTKINLLTGEIHNEVGKDLIVNSSTYLKLQQLHLDQIVASHRIVQAQLQQIQAILAAGKSNPSIDPIPERLDLTDALPTRLTEAFKAILTSSTEDSSRDNLDRISAPRQNIPTAPAEDLTFSRLPQPSPPLSQPILSPIAFDDDIDLSLDETTVEWEEWIEAENIESEPEISSSIAAIPEVQISAWGGDWEQQSPQRTTVKPSKPRTTITSTSIDPSEQWDKFVPEHVGIYVECEPNSNVRHDPHQVDRLLADLDKIGKG